EENKTAIAYQKSVGWGFKALFPLPQITLPFYCFSLHRRFLRLHLDLFMHYIVVHEEDRGLQLENYFGNQDCDRESGPPRKNHGFCTARSNNDRMDRIPARTNRR